MSHPTIDPIRAEILEAARRQQRKLLRGLAIAPFAMALPLYRPIVRHHWGTVAVATALLLLVPGFLLVLWRNHRPRSPVMRALLDEPARVVAICVRDGAVLVWLDRRRVVGLRPAGSPDELARRLRARSPDASRFRPT